MKYIKHIIYGIVILLVSLQFKTCFISSTNSDLRADTVEVIKYIPSKQNVFKRDSLVYVYIDKYIDTSKQYEKLFKSLEKKYNKKVDSNTILRELLQATRQRKYKETFKDSVLDAEVIAYTTGSLDSLKFTYKTKPLEVRYNEINNYITPRFIVLAGVDFSAGGMLNSSALGVNLGIQTKKGSIYTLGYDTEKNIKFSTYINIFEKY